MPEATTIATTANIPTTTTSALMSLPYEIRSQIWSHLHSSTTQRRIWISADSPSKARLEFISVTANNRFVPLSSLPKHLFMADLLQVNHQMRSEILSLTSSQDINVIINGPLRRVLERLPFAIVQRSRSLTLTLGMGAIQQQRRWGVHWQANTTVSPPTGPAGDLRQKIESALWDCWGCKWEDRLNMIRHDQVELGKCNGEERWYKIKEMRGLVRVEFNREERMEWKRQWEDLARSFDRKIREHEEEKENGRRARLGEAEAHAGEDLTLEETAMDSAVAISG